MSNHEQFKNIDSRQFTKLAKGYLSAKDNLQLAIGAAVYQLTQDNPNWLNHLFENAGFWQSPVNDKFRLSVDGRIVYAYLTTPQEDGGCGLTADIIKLDRTTKKWKYNEHKSVRRLYLEELDKEFLFDLLASVRFDRWGKPKAEKDKTVYNPAPALAKLASNLKTADTVDTDDFPGLLAQVEAIRKMLMAKKPAIVKIAA